MRNSDGAVYWVFSWMIVGGVDGLLTLITGSGIHPVLFLVLIFAFTLLPSLMFSFLFGLYRIGKYLFAIPYATYLILWIYGPKWLKPRVKDLLYLTKSRILNRRWLFHRLVRRV